MFPDKREVSVGLKTLALKSLMALPNILVGFIALLGVSCAAFILWYMLTHLVGGLVIVAVLVLCYYAGRTINGR